MSPFWKNVNEELQYQGMNLKTLAALTGIPYTTITNGRNRPDSIPTADVALKISKVLNKSLEMLLGDAAKLPENSLLPENKISDIRNQYLLQKYESLITSLEKCSEKVQDSFIRMADAINEDMS
ncbi:MAG: helix-turn-helix domain-containing protein [Treponema sp.]|nr:helix-turn-helix domain-containing protein [Treponema sp.]